MNDQGEPQPAPAELSTGRQEGHVGPARASPPDSPLGLAPSAHFSPEFQALTTPDLSPLQTSDLHETLCSPALVPWVPHAQLSNPRPCVG
jgi:hypothetical protein